jgi:hypothetical protein
MHLVTGALGKQPGVSEMAYYKTSDAGVLAAWKAYRESADRLQVLGEEFAKRYVGATALFQSSVHSGRNFYGMKFKPPMPQPLWTKPDPKADGSQFPRSSLPPGTKGEERKALKLELEKLQEEFKAHKPKDKADLQPFLDAMGLGGGALFFAGYKQVATPDCIYVSTSAKPNGVMTEILGSEFEAVEQANP